MGRPASRRRVDGESGDRRRVDEKSADRRRVDGQSVGQVRVDRESAGRRRVKGSPAIGTSMGSRRRLAGRLGKIDLGVDGVLGFSGFQSTSFLGWIY